MEIDRNKNLFLLLRLALLCVVITALSPFRVIAEEINEEMDPLELLACELSAIDDAEANWQPDMQIALCLPESRQPDFMTNASINLLSKINNPPDLRTELQQLINKIYSVEFKSEDSPPAAVMFGSSVEISEPEQKKAEQKKTGQNDAYSYELLAADALSGKQISNRTIQLLDEILQKPQQIGNPLELADILFRLNMRQQAGVCYRAALDKMVSSEKKSFSTQAWILFQLGNCLQKNDYDSSMQMYKQLIVEFPDSPWTEIAKVKSNIVDWYAKDKPDLHINRNQSR